MTYIFLVAGRGTRLQPLTLKNSKSLYKLDKNTTVLQRMVKLIKEFDKSAEIVVVVGFMAKDIKKKLEGVVFIDNPFYGVTNSIASLWFAKEYLDRDNVTIINGDIVMSRELVSKIVCAKTDKPTVLIDSSIKNNGDYNVEIKGEKVLVMSKELDEYYGEYAGVTKLDRSSANILKEKMIEMVEDGMYDQWYENALVQLIFDDDFALYHKDISEFQWTEVDKVGDMLLAKKIHLDS
ncbi:MAG: hypothetical protein RR846_10730 [Oscillospiraceae bacterium]